MPKPSRTQILRLYKYLIRYGNQLKLTDKDYFINRVKNEFKENKILSTEQEIQFYFKEKLFYVTGESFRMSKLIRMLRPMLPTQGGLINTQLRYLTYNIDYSHYPKLEDGDVEETYVRGSGPGGQAVNKTSNCVVLRHRPTNIVIKCHVHRSTTENRKQARKMLLDKLDLLYNGDMSVAAQKRDIDKKKSADKLRKHKKNKELKMKWKRENSILNKD